MTLSRRQVKMREATKPAWFPDAAAGLRYLHHIHYKQRKRIARRSRRLAKRKAQGDVVENES